MNPSQSLRSGLFSFLLLLAIACAGCIEPLDFERQQAERGTFGEELHAIVLKDLVRTEEQGPVKAAAFDAGRADFVSAIDVLFPREKIDAIDGLLFDLLPDVETDMLPGFLRKVAVLLDDSAENGAFMQAMVRSLQRPDSIDPANNPSMLTRLFAYEEIGPLNDMLVDMILKLDGRAGGSQVLMSMLEEGTRALADASVSGDPERLSILLMRVLLSDDEQFRPTQGDAAPMYAVRLDHRGLPKVPTNDIGALPSPFIDRDGDGLADVDPESGVFIDSDGVPLAGRAPFGAPGDADGVTRDDSGRLLASNGSLSYEYIDLHATALGYLLREARPMLEDDLLFDLIDAMRPILGATSPQSDERGTYPGYAPDNPIIGLTAGLLIALDQQDIPALLEGTVILLRDHEPMLAAVLRVLEQAVDVTDAHPSNTAETLTLLEELLPILKEISAEPGLLEAVLEAASAETTRASSSMLELLLRYRSDRIYVAKDGPYDACYKTCAGTLTIGTVERMSCIQACPHDEIFSDVLDRSATPSQSNRALFERLLGIIWESSGQQYNMRFIQFRIDPLDLINVTDIIGDAMVIEDMALAYLATITGDLALGDVLNPELSQLAVPLGLDDDSMVSVMLWVTTNVLFLEMDPYPKPGQLVRLFNKDPLGLVDADGAIEFNKAICRSGRFCIDAHADALFAAEASGMVDVLYPFVKAFRDHDRMDLFVSIMAKIYEHYPSIETRDLDINGDPLPLKTDNLRSFEPALLALVTETPLLKVLADFGDVTRAMFLDDGSRFIDHLAPFAAFALTPDPTLALIKGDTFALDAAGGRIEPLTPLHLLTEPLGDLDDLLTADAKADAAWDRAVTRITDLVLGVEGDPATGDARFLNPGGLVLGQLVVEELRREWLSLEAKGTRSEKLRVTYPADIADLFSGRILPMGIEMMDWIQAREGSKELLRSILSHMMTPDEATPTVLLAATHTAFVEMLDEENLVELLHHTATLLDPAKSWDVIGFPELTLLSHVGDLLESARQKDPERILIGIIQRGFTPLSSGESPMGLSGDVLGAVHRVNPGEGTALNAADYAHIFRALSHTVRDEQRGGERIFDLAKYVLSGGATGGQ